MYVQIVSQLLFFCCPAGSSMDFNLWDHKDQLSHWTTRYCVLVCTKPRLLSSVGAGLPVCWTTRYSATCMSTKTDFFCRCHSSRTVPLCWTSRCSVIYTRLFCSVGAGLQAQLSLDYRYTVKHVPELFCSVGAGLQAQLPHWTTGLLSNMCLGCIVL